MKNKVLKYILIGLSVAAGAYMTYCFVYAIMIFNALGIFDKSYSANEMLEHFNANRKYIYEVKNYFSEIQPKGKDVEIEFEDDEISRLSITPNDTAKYANKAVEFLDWHIKTGSKKMDSLLVVLGWNNNILEELKRKLDKAGCISITNREPVQIGFKRVGLGIYFFNVFDKPIPDKLISRYNDSCTYILVNKMLVIEYGGGAVGGQCFPK